jgi:hypothetical protein
MDFGMRIARPLVPALAHDPIFANQDATYARVRVGCVEPPRGEFERSGHEGLVLLAMHSVAGLLAGGF